MLQRIQVRWPGLANCLLRQAHRLQLARLRLEAARPGARRKGRPPRIVATACWRFPIYSQTFVQQEAAAMAQAGFNLRFFHAQTNPRAELAHPSDLLWGLKRRLILHRLTGADDLAHYRARWPDRVARLLQRLGAAAGLDPVALLAHEHVLQAFSFTRAVEAWRADYLHSYFFYEQSLFAWVASTLLGLPRGISCYADHVLDDYALKLVCLQLDDAAVVVATSQRIRGELEILHGSALTSVIVKPNAIDARSFLPRPQHTGPRDCLRLLSVCRLDPKKGLEYLIGAVALLRQRGVPVQLRIAGAHDADTPGAAEYVQALHQAADRSGLAGAVIFLGRCGSHQVRAELAASDAFVGPFVEQNNGDKDGIPTAVLEAMAAGCAIVTTDAGSLCEIIQHGREALVVGQRDSRALADALQCLWQDPGLARRLGEAAAARARAEFDVSVCEQALHAAVRAALARTGAGQHQMAVGP